MLRAQERPLFGTNDDSGTQCAVNADDYEELLFGQSYGELCMYLVYRSTSRLASDSTVNIRSVLYRWVHPASDSVFAYGIPATRYRGGNES